MTVSCATRSAVRQSWRLRRLPVQKRDVQKRDTAPDTGSTRTQATTTLSQPSAKDAKLAATLLAAAEAAFQGCQFERAAQASQQVLALPGAQQHARAQHRQRTGLGLVHARAHGYGHACVACAPVTKALCFFVF